MLFDEPLSNLDARLRDQVRAQIHELHERLHFTAVFVTHDQREALALGDRLAIMKAGRIEQFDTPEQVFEEPATEYVADFIGMSNRLELERQGTDWSLAGHTVHGQLPVPSGLGSVAVRLRADDVVLAPVDQPLDGDVVSFVAEVVDAQFGGATSTSSSPRAGTASRCRCPAAASGDGRASCRSASR